METLKSLRAEQGVKKNLNKNMGKNNRVLKPQWKKSFGDLKKYGTRKDGTKASIYDLLLIKTGQVYEKKFLIKCFGVVGE